MNYNKTLEEGLKLFDDNLSEIFYTRPNTGKEATKNKETVKSFLTSFAEKIREGVVREVEGMKKRELSHSEIQLLDRHEREEYGEEVVGYNKALQDQITHLKRITN